MVLCREHTQAMQRVRAERDNLAKDKASLQAKLEQANQAKANQETTIAALKAGSHDKLAAECASANRALLLTKLKHTEARCTTVGR